MGFSDEPLEDFAKFSNTLFVVNDVRGAKDHVFLQKVSIYAHEKETLRIPNAPMLIKKISKFNEKETGEY